ncbi:hypothetical protein M3484_22445 [Pseudomonas sp. GX19020]|uniref:hypothetical protein n=1 Tax=Pseudomonas sp. GX19020 TaxID=2942277 RepID=UPI0020197A59|nr:hypothetical protein [Pseudomonas sp. GX19020]MCL4069322.1 hypothetical protein [Pseudomonas sp. GX19020]
MAAQMKAKFNEGSGMSKISTATGFLLTKIVFFCVVVSLISSFAVAYGFYAFMSESVFYSNESCYEAKKFQFCYFGEAKVWSDSSYLQTITGFYSSVITVLIGIIAIVATVGAYTIKSSLKAQAEQELPTLIDGYFRQVDGHKKIIDAASAQVDIVTQDVRALLNNLPIPERGEFISMVNAIERRLEALEVRILEEEEQ